MKEKKRIKIINYAPAIIVMMISAAALVPGFLQDNVSSEADSNDNELNEKIIDYDYFTEIQLRVFEHDSNLYEKMWDEISYAYSQDLQLSILGSAATATENITYVKLIINALFNAHLISLQTYSFIMDREFTIDPLRDNFYFGSSSTGAQYTVDRTAWSEKPTYLHTTLGDFIEDYFIDWYGIENTTMFSPHTMQVLYANFSDELTYQYGFLHAPRIHYILNPGCNFYNITQLPLFELENDILELREQLQYYQGLESDYQMAVSVMTIATLLATVMSGRLDERKVSYKVSVIRSDIKSDDSLIIKEVDAFSLSILIVALLMAMFGIISAFLI
ncbi:MAG: hypothetical protein ACFFDW_16435 [Candidatus Thorarchaeota archaeon]